MAGSTSRRSARATPPPTRGCHIPFATRPLDHLTVRRRALAQLFNVKHDVGHGMLMPGKDASRPARTALHTPADVGLRNAGESPLVNRSPRGPKRPKVRIGISPDPALLEWVDE